MEHLAIRLCKLQCRGCADPRCFRLQGNLAKHFLDDRSMKTYEELSSRTIELKLVRRTCCTTPSRMMT